MFDAIRPAPASVPPSINMSPPVPVIRIDEMPQVPTRYVLAWIRTGGAGLSHSSQSLQAAAKAGPAVWIGALGCSTCGGGFWSGTTIGSSCAAATNAKLPNIARAVDVDHAAGCGRRRLGRQPADGLGDLVGRSHPAERDVGDDLRPAAAGQIFLGHFRYGEARGDREAENSLGRITARDRPGHADHCALRSRIMPMLRAIATKGGAARDVDDPAALPFPFPEMANGETAEVGRRLEVDGHRSLPPGVPLILLGMIGDAFIDTGIVDESIDAPAEPPERRFPNAFGGGRVGEVARDQLVAAAAGMASDIVAARLQEVVRCRADTAACSGDEDVHRPSISSPAFAGEGDRRSWWRGPSVSPVARHPPRNRGEENQAAIPLTNALADDLKLAICSLKRPKPCSTSSMSLATFSVSLRIAAMVELIESAASAVSSTAAVIIVTVWA